MKRIIPIVLFSLLLQIPVVYTNAQTFDPEKEEEKIFKDLEQARKGGKLFDVELVNGEWRGKSNTPTKSNPSSTERSRKNNNNSEYNSSNERNISTNKSSSVRSNDTNNNIKSKEEEEFKANHLNVKKMLKGDIGKNANNNNSFGLKNYNNSSQLKQISNRDQQTPTIENSGKTNDNIKTTTRPQIKNTSESGRKKDNVVIISPHNKVKCKEPRYQMSVQKQNNNEIIDDISAPATLASDDLINAKIKELLSSGYTNKSFTILVLRGMQSTIKTASLSSILKDNIHRIMYSNTKSINMNDARLFDKEAKDLEKKANEDAAQTIVSDINNRVFNIR